MAFFASSGDALSSAALLSCKSRPSTKGFRSSCWSREIIEVCAEDAFLALKILVLYPTTGRDTDTSSTLGGGLQDGNLKSLVVVAVVAKRLESQKPFIRCFGKLTMPANASCPALCRWIPMVHDRCFRQPAPRGCGWFRPSRFFAIGEARERCLFWRLIRTLSVTQAVIAIVVVVYCYSKL